MSISWLQPSLTWDRGNTWKFPLLSFPYGSFVAASPWISFILSSSIFPSICLMRNCCCCSFPPLSLPLSAVSHFTCFFLLLHSPELNSVTAPWQFPFAGDSGNWIWCLGDLPGMMSQLCRKKYPM